MRNMRDRSNGYSSFLNHIKEAMFNVVYEQTVKNSKKAIDALITRNNKLLKSQFIYFSYKGTQYIGSNSQLILNNCGTKNFYIVKLHESLHSEMDKYREKYEKVLHEEMLTVDAYLTALLLEIKSSADAEKLLPECLASIFKANLKNSSKEACSLPEDKIKELHEKTKEHKQLVMDRMLMNILEQ